jgi:rubrerythrin
MTLEEAIKTAIEYETRIHDLYQKEAAAIKDPQGKNVLRALGVDELHHITYLLKTRDQWRETGQLIVERLESTLPPMEKITANIDAIKSNLTLDDLGDEKLILSRALKLEMETSDFYRKMAEEMSDEAQQMFARFLELEKQHIDVVQAELDHLSKTGYWFGFKEFDME